GAGQDVTPSDDINSATPKSSSKTLTSHDPIYIDGNTAFAENASTEGWAGDGTEGNPYILQNPYITENYNINASTAHGIYIENTDVYFIIRNCTIYDGKSNQNGGIYFYNVTNGKIDNVTSYNNAYGIYTYSSSNNNINANYVYNNSLGIYLSYCSNNNIVSNCTVYNNYYGVHLLDSSNNQITNCTVHNNYGRGISLYDSSNNNVATNQIYNNADGIYLYYSSDTEIHYNNIYNNTDHGVYSYTGGYTANAIYNWWGDASGPYHPDTNPSGTGDNVTDNVIYKPWTGEVSYLYVTVTANPTSVSSAETSTITITVTDGTNLVSGATLNLQSDNGGSFSSVTDNGDGTYTATFTAPNVTIQTVCRITTAASKTDYNSASGYVDVTVVGEVTDTDGDGVSETEKKEEKGFIPGFEMLSLIIILAGCAILLKNRKRLQ
ncbi:MAG: right-handed parallel beta-helix repeat-containing protein, partial [Thermoplasmatales archaeon]|nr:right-handed parallel beta-helix repeat-containing protein [Thermoplasmatales archaeon]